MYCPIPIETPPETEVVVTCAVRPDLKVSQLVLHFRPAGTEDFTPVAMPRSLRGWFRGVIPASATEGKTLQFFVQGEGAGEANSGSADSPNLLVVKDGAMPVEEAVAKELRGGGDEPADEPEQIRASRDDDDSPVRRGESARTGRRRAIGRFWASFGLGTAYGWQPGGKLEFRQEREITSGGLPGGLFHILPEVGYQLMKNFSVSLQARLQYVPEDGFGDAIGGTPANRAFSLLARGSYTLDLIEDRLQGLVSACVGGGDGFRLRVPADRSVELVRSDTVRGGPLLFGVGGGVVYNFTNRISWPTEVRTIIGFPSSAVAFELGSGVAFTF